MKRVHPAAEQPHTWREQFGPRYKKPGQAPVVIGVVLVSLAIVGVIVGLSIAIQVLYP